MSTLLLIACSDNTTPQPLALVQQNAPKLGYLAPDFQLNQFGTNQALKLSDFKGKPVLINFWQSSCEPCTEEMPELADAYYQHQKDGLIILGVNVREGDYRIGKYLTGKNFDWTMLLDSMGKVSDSYNVGGYPSSFFVNKAGFIQFIQLGRLDKTTLNNNLAKIIAS